ncbi:PREDICTED: uncharacterized protein LOC108763283 isoform X2 [Trachymyrmex cornetzi]|uniref:uncharacterized protein LOC108763283 isoform X2 n=1 Tax=Trachymyrmex cornetzi TaxID=471704 RepID=UPI00084EE88C|nr:PREDICTED: uncharacterized protein LOC108763283 isoform X2 [Trachymyrmex cornetzi]
MPRKYKNKGIAAPVDFRRIWEAIKLLKIDQSVSIRSAADCFDLVPSTLLRHMKTFDVQFPPDERIFDSITEDEALSFFKSTTILGGKPMFDLTEENALMSYIMKCSTMNYGLSINDIRTLAYEYGKKLGIAIPERWTEEGQATRDWYYGFMGRHKNISLRKPQSTSFQRLKGFCRESVDEFFTNLKAVLEETQFAEHRIWNIDESGFSTVPTQPVKVVAQKGAKLGSFASAERGTNVTVVVSVSAAGTTIPPFFLFPRKNMKSIFMENSPPGSIGFANECGWMTVADFLVFLQHFIKFTSASKDNPLLLIMDNHISHVSIEAIDLCVHNGIIVLTLPPHCSHRMQPLNVSVFGPVKKTYAVKVHEWGLSNAGRKFEIHHVAGAVDKALTQSCTALNIRSGFAATGIFPINTDIFTEDDFPSAQLSSENLMAEEGIDDVRNLSIAQTEEVSTTASAVTSTSAAAISATSTSTASTSQSLATALISVGPVHIIAPMPKSNRGRKSLKSSILTSPDNVSDLWKKADDRAKKADDRTKKAKKLTPSSQKKIKANAQPPKKHNYFNFIRSEQA